MLKSRIKEPSKKERIKRYFQQGHILTQRDAIQLFKSYRLSAIVHSLRDEGMNIHNLKKSGHAVYKLIPEGELAL
tara:strand:+ start:465 stop:689 length:225 start_codon:yes stop_codon:yes gene_type:complete